MLTKLARALLMSGYNRQFQERQMKRLELQPGYYDIAIAFICVGMTFGMLLKSTL